MMLWRKSLERLSTGKKNKQCSGRCRWSFGRLQAQFQDNQDQCYHSKFAKCAFRTYRRKIQSLSAAGKIVDRMAELRTMAQDITKNTGDIENYSKEFIELQSQLNQISKEKFNGISLFGTSNASAVAGGVKHGNG